MQKEDSFVNHKEKDFTLVLPSALLFEFKLRRMRVHLMTL